MLINFIKFLQRSATNILRVTCFKNQKIYVVYDTEGLYGGKFTFNLDCLYLNLAPRIVLSTIRLMFPHYVAIWLVNYLFSCILHQGKLLFWRFWLFTSRFSSNARKTTCTPIRMRNYVGFWSWNTAKWYGLVDPIIHNLTTL